MIIYASVLFTLSALVAAVDMSRGGLTGVMSLAMLFPVYGRCLEWF